MGLQARHALIAAGLTALFPAAADAVPRSCPEIAEIHESIRRIVTAERLRAPRLRTVDRFEFGPVTYDDVMRLELPHIADGYHCAVHVTYTFRMVSQTGEEQTARIGTHVLHAFRQDAFGEWEFRIQVVKAEAQ